MKGIKGNIQTRFAKLRRHLSDILPHLTVRKIINALLIEYEFSTSKTSLKGKPYWLKIETARVCNLKCPKCYAHSDVKDPYYPGTEGQMRLMSFDILKLIIDELKDYLLGVQLYDEGEPLLNPEIYNMIQYAHKANIGTMISSNFSLPLTNDDFKKMIESGLDHIVIGIDGSTQVIYEMTRVNGDLALVISNTKNLLSIRGKANKKKPVVEIQFLIKPFNLHQIDEVKELSKELKADIFNALKIQGFWQEIEPTEKTSPKKCPIPWSSMVVQWNGDITVCPLRDHTDLITNMNIQDNTLLRVFNSSYYQNLRNQHNNVNDENRIAVPCCLDCNFNEK